MEALVCRKLGDPTATEPGSTESPVEVSKTYPIPPLTSDTAVRVKVTATSLNFANYLQILGKYQEKPPLPFIPGSDYSGIVDAIGPSVTKFRVGDRVCSFAALGSYAQFIVADQSLLFVTRSTQTHSLSLSLYLGLLWLMVVGVVSFQVPCTGRMRHDRCSCTSRCVWDFSCCSCP